MALRKLKVVRCDSPYARQALALARDKSLEIRHDTIHQGTVFMYCDDSLEFNHTFAALA